MELNPFEHIEGRKLTGTRWDYGYKQLVESITGDVYWGLDAGFTDWQGDYFFLGYDESKAFYFVAGGYGSCSGCDALEGCDTIEELEELRDDLKRDIRKFDSLEEFEEWFNTDGQMQYYNREDLADFIQEADKKFGIKLKWREDS